MTSTKRKAELTTDDLLRQQEESSNKRTRVLQTSSYVRTQDYDSDEEEEEEEDEALSDPEEDSEEEDSENSVTEAPAFTGHDRFGDSRLKQSTISQSTKRTTKSFHDLGIIPPLQAALTSMSIRSPTEVQNACIPPLLQGRDCIGNAKTGSGKTIAFALPILQKLSVDPFGIFALILTPTRELAFQIAEQFAVLGSSVSVRTAVIVGGMDMMEQALELNNRPHVVVATPGRLVDLLNSSNGEWNLSRVQFLVLDEADRLLTPSFAPELAQLFEAMPKDRQTCLFTATLTPSIEALATAPPRDGKQTPFVHRTTTSIETVSTLTQTYLLVPSHARELYLYHILCNPPESTIHLRKAPPEPKPKGGKPSKRKTKKAADAEEQEQEQPPPTIIFCTKPRTAAYLTALLKTLEIRTTALHSRLTQRDRMSSLALFKSAVIPVLVSTDVGARGLDIEDVAMVINWDLPNEPEEYTHRVGRTARAGRGGLALSFVTEKDEERVHRIETRIGEKPELRLLQRKPMLTDDVELTGTELTEMALSESKVLEKLNTVSTAKRLANMELHDTEFGKREEIQKSKAGVPRVRK